jgi:acyl carrier protein
MSREEILETLTELLQDILDDDNIVLTPETTARDVRGWDSLANVRFVLSVERRFKTKFAAAEVAGLKNVAGLVDIIEARA